MTRPRGEKSSGEELSGLPSLTRISRHPQGFAFNERALGAYRRNSYRPLQASIWAGKVADRAEIVDPESLVRLAFLALDR
jgi:hypothetical protein